MSTLQNGVFDEKDIDCLQEKMRKHCANDAHDEQFYANLKNFGNGFLQSVKDFVEKHKGI